MTMIKYYMLIWLKSGENKPFNSIKLNQPASNSCFIIYIIRLANYYY